MASVVERCELSADWKHAIEMQVHSGPSGPVRGLYSESTVSDINESLECNILCVV